MNNLSKTLIISGLAGILILSGCSKEIVKNDTGYKIEGDSTVLASSGTNPNEQPQSNVDNKLKSAIATEIPEATSAISTNEKVKSTESTTANPTTKAITSADNNNSSNKIADTKKSALEILKNSVKIDNGLKFLDAAMDENSDGTCKSSYKWNDGSYYAFTLGTEEAMGDIGSLFLVKKNTRDIYKLDLEKDVNGNVLKKYQP